MNGATIERLEADIQQLSLTDQLLLIERLAQSIRQSAAPTWSALDSQLAAMADDPQIQRELRLIEGEFAGTEADGLEETA